ncbi:MAG: intradiol ring-cleavage dioxygenase [Ferruginibacter sp.]|nr:intradiol ring-cleavage dioxygenase [Cytophagales bacterium]
MNNKLLRDERRRQLIQCTFFFAFALPSLVAVNSSCQAQTNRRQPPPAAIVGGGCDGCEGMYEGMPPQLNWQTAVASASEPGERLEISGIVYRPGGETPASGIIIYLWQTDVTGHYTPAPNTTGHPRTHGHLRGWLKTNERGEYQFTTIKPAPYPNDVIPAHIHPSVKEPNKNEYYIEDFLFDDDPLLTRQERAKLENRGGSGILHLTKREGMWVGSRNIILGLHIPNYR